MRKSNSTERVENFAAVSGTLTKKEAKGNLGLTDEQVLYGFDNLVRQSRLRRIGHGLYQFVDAVEKPPVEGVDKIWKAMRISGKFSVAEIAKLASSSNAYVYKRFRKYRADGFIREAGVRPTHGSGQEKLWRLTPQGKEKALDPHVEVWTPDPLIQATVNLNRLICSGIALRSREMAQEALSLVGIITSGLEAVVEEK